MSIDAPPPDHVYSVSDFSREVRDLLEMSYPRVWIEGEIGNLSTPSSGHSYFSLKDDRAKVRCALFRQRKLRCAAAPREGLRVLLMARVSLYEPRGDFQLIVDYMEEAGEGALRQAMEALKRRLSAEGLFADERKRALPAMPQCLGIVSSPTGAALRDILVTLARTAPWLPVIVYPATVQGETAPASIVTAIERARARSECDVLIVARGGGSLEDLKAFNDEAVARAIFACEIPVVSGVGHETDVTIADLVADTRAATPTAAAQLIGASTERLNANLLRFEERLGRTMEGVLYKAMQAVDRVCGRIRHPLERIRHQLTRVDHARHRLVSLASGRLASLEVSRAQLRARLELRSPAREIALRGRQLDTCRERLASLASAAVAARRARIDVVTRQLEHLSPNHTLARGYAILSDPRDRSIITRVRNTRVGQQATARLADGTLDLEVTGKKSN